MSVINHIKSLIIIPLPRIGKRNIKSMLAIILCFFIWQITRFFAPGYLTEIHPLYAYVSAILAMRDTVPDSFIYGKIRFKGTLIGLILALICIAISMEVQNHLHITYIKVGVEFLIIVVGVSLTLYTAHILKCNNLCAIAGVVFLVCIIRYSTEQRYNYAIFRAFETILGIGASLFVNRYVFAYKKSESQ